LPSTVFSIGEEFCASHVCAPRDVGFLTSKRGGRDTLNVLSRF
jgi:hypothetical protein